MGKGSDGHELSRLAGGGCDGSDTTFKRGDALFEGVDSGLNRWRVSDMGTWFEALRVEAGEKGELGRGTFMIRL